VGGSGFERSELSAAVAWLPVIGALLGLVVGVAYAFLAVVLTPLVAAFLAVAVGILLTGALHEDGLADTADAFGGGGDREETLMIMKDPTHGSYGVIALVLSIGTRVASLAALGAIPALVALPVAHSLARASAAALAGTLPPASADGMGAAHAGEGVGRAAPIGCAAAVLIAIAVLGMWGIAFAALAGFVTVGMGMLAMRRISGFTGDVLGAAEQVVEVTLLVLAAGLAGSGLLAPAPWWT
jgi:adenosylcobinamide-GDP ribazoletransferase